jgi:hypothetical protein
MLDRCKFTEAQRLLWSCQSTLMYAVTAFKVSQDDEALKEFARRFKPAYDQLQDASERCVLFMLVAVRVCGVWMSR